MSCVCITWDLSNAYQQLQLGRLMRIGMGNKARTSVGRATKAAGDFDGYLAMAENCEAELEQIIDSLQVILPTFSTATCLCGLKDNVFYIKTDRKPRRIEPAES